MPGIDGAAGTRRWSPSQMTTAALILGAALATWIIVVVRMRGMDAGPGTDLGSLGWYVGIWVTMMAAMMLPSVAPMVLVFHRVSSERAQARAELRADMGVRLRVLRDLGAVRAGRLRPLPARSSTRPVASSTGTAAGGGSPAGRSRSPACTS